MATSHVTTPTPPAMSSGHTTEAIQVQAGVMVEQIKALLHEGNVRRITIRNAEGHTVIEVPVTAGVMVAVVAPVLTAVAAITAAANEWEIVVERIPPRDSDPRPSGVPAVLEPTS